MIKQEHYCPRCLKEGKKVEALVSGVSLSWGHVAILACPKHIKETKEFLKKMDAN